MTQSVKLFFHADLTKYEIIKVIRSKKIRYAGNFNLKIYGRLDCRSGKKMKQTNRVFFQSKKDAKELGFRPCGHCMRIEYLHWKNGLI
ncbi:MAG: hypothetical protein O9301_05420 [Leptospira sp.]|nr:hypothetical protein [Leptospira sp.]